MAELLKTKTSNVQCSAGTWCVILCNWTRQDQAHAKPYLRRISNRSPCIFQLKLSTCFLEYLRLSFWKSGLSNKQHICRPVWDDWDSMLEFNSAPKGGYTDLKICHAGCFSFVVACVFLADWKQEKQTFVCCL